MKMLISGCISRENIENAVFYERLTSVKVEFASGILEINKYRTIMKTLDILKEIFVSPSSESKIELLKPSVRVASKATREVINKR